MVSMKTMTKGGLQIRMTVFVTAAVLLVSALASLIIAGRVRKDIEGILQERISDDLVSITRIMEQRLLRVESSTGAIATMAPQMLSGGVELDSFLCRCVGVLDDVRGVSIVFDREHSPGMDGYYERFARYDTSGTVSLGTYINGVELASDDKWQNCYVEGMPVWDEISGEYTNGWNIICYMVPLTGEDGNRFGVLYSALLEGYLTSFVTEYKLRKDIDISIYKANGTMVVAPDDYILKLAPEDMIVRESVIDHIGWKVVLSADRRIIDRSVNKAMLFLLLTFILMFIVVFLAIRLTVRYVANPFIAEQRRTEKENAVMENEMRLASGAQRGLVPHVFPPFPERKGIDLSACLYPARKVGGDLYDYFLTGDRLYFCIGDVSGKGVQASLFMSATHYLFRSVAADMPLADAVRHINVSLCTDNEQCRFVTFWMGCLDLGSGSLEYVNAGHDAPLLVRDGKVDDLPASENMPLGVWDEEKYVSGSFTLLPGDSLLLYTDGVTEAMDTGGHEYGRERLHETIGRTAVPDARLLIESVLGSVRQHSTGAEQSDDITMLCLRFIEKETSNN